MIWPTALVARSIHLEPGQFLFRKGADTASVFRLVSGRLRLERHTFDGRLITVPAGIPGELVFKAALFSDTYSCDASATEHTVVDVIPKPTLMRALREDAHRALHVAALLARDLENVHRRLELRNVRSAQDRFCLYLEFVSASEPRCLELTGPIQDIAAELGMTREALYRTLAILERKGRIRRSHRRIQLTRHRPETGQA